MRNRVWDTQSSTEGRLQSKKQRGKENDLRDRGVGVFRYNSAFARRVTECGHEKFVSLDGSAGEQVDTGPTSGVGENFAVVALSLSVCLSFGLRIPLRPWVCS